MKDCTTCRYGYEDERLGIPMCHHPKRFSEDCIDFNMHEEKEIKESKKPIPNDLEEAADMYEKQGDLLPCRIMRSAVEPSSPEQSYQAKQLLQDSPMPEDTVLFNKGVAEGRRLEREDMMEDAVEGEVDWYDGPILNYPIDQLCEVLSKMDIDVGDKVRIVVCKKEDEK